MDSLLGFIPVGHYLPQLMRGLTPEVIGQVDASLLQVRSTSLQLLHPTPVGLTAALHHFLKTSPLLLTLKLLLQLN